MLKLHNVQTTADYHNTCRLYCNVICRCYHQCGSPHCPLTAFNYNSTTFHDKQVKSDGLSCPLSEM